MADEVDNSKPGERIQLAVFSRDQLGLELTPTIERLSKIAVELMDLRRGAPAVIAEYLETAIARQLLPINELRNLAGLPRIAAMVQICPTSKNVSGVGVGHV